MGTAGNRKGYKAFSINTTIRNPRRNKEFLEALISFDGELFTNEKKTEYYRELIKSGIYNVSKVSEKIKNKYMTGQELSKEEVDELINNNPQATRDTGRVITQIRALKDQGFLRFEGTRSKYKIHISSLGKALLNKEKNDFDVYIKAMIGTQWGSPSRATAENKSIPFLNTLFVIQEVNKIWKKIEGHSNGVTSTEFAAFILTMTDCNYEETAKQIITYRENNRYEVNQAYIEDYIYNEKQILNIKFNTLVKDYADDVFRKYEMTNLIIKRGSGRFIDFNKREIEKINLILEKYKDYNWKDFVDTEAYYEYIENIKLPWEENTELQNKILNSKLQDIEYEIDSSKTYEEISNDIERIYSNKIFKEIDIPYSIELIKEELEMINQNVEDEKSSFKAISKPIRLEWLISLLISKKFGSKGVNSNLIYDSNGIPMSHAPGGLADIEFYNKHTNFLFEVTTIRNKSQQLNAETTSIARHLREYLKINKNEMGAIFIAPYVHFDTCRYYKFEMNDSDLLMLPLTISKFLTIVTESENLNEFNSKILELRENFKNMKTERYMDYIN